MKKIVFYTILVFSLFATKKSLANHAAAVDLTYVCLGGNQYSFTLKLYRDCAGPTVGANVNLNLESLLCGENYNLSISRISTTEVSQVCGAEVVNTTCNGGTLPGIQEYIYTGTTTLPANCTDWRVSYRLANRNSAITNIINGQLYTDVRIDNTGGNCNNSPTFSGIPILYSCVGEPVNFNNAAVDGDGDSLVYQLVQPWDNVNTPLPYTDPGFNPNNPMYTTGGFIFDSINGQITFTSPGLQQAVVSVLITEYDTLGNYKGTIRRDIQFIIINCPPPPFEPVVTGVNYDSTNFTFNACYTDPFCFNIYGTSGDPSVPVVITYDGGIPGGSFSSYQNVDTTFGTFCWNPGTSTGNYTFRLRLEADICPVKRVNVFNYTVNIDTTFTSCSDSTVYVDAFGNATVDSTYVVVTPNNSCVVQSVDLGQSVFDCSEIGVNNITVRTEYTSGLVKNCVSQITVLDTLPPSVVCQDTTIYLNSSGTFTIDSSYIDNGSMDNCAIQSMALSKYSFNCSDVGVNIITLYVTDIYGNIDSCTANVTIIDSIPPNPVCKDTTIYLNVGGNFTIDSSYIENGSTDICGIATITLSNYTYTCANTGTNPVTMYVTDINGNIDSCTANVIVADNIPPAPVCKDTTIYLNVGGSFTIDSSYIENGSSDACGITTTTLSNYSYTCADIGINPITMYVTDVNNNIDSCTANVIVADNIPPAPVCKDTTIYLNAAGNFTIDSSYIENGSTDACGITAITLSNYSYTCADIGINPITMYVTDVNNNIDSCTANVIVFDTIPPTPICKDTTIYLNAGGTFIIDSSFINNGSADNCAIATITLNNYNFNCTDTGINLVTMYVTDVNGNSDSCTANVIVIDNTLPNSICKDTTIYLNTGGNFTIDSSFIDNGSTDNCAIATITLNNYNFNCTNLGVNTVTMYVVDVNGNLDSCTANVTLNDSIVPTPICKDTTIHLNATGNFTIDSSFINNGSNDNCAISTITLSKYNFNCIDVGINPITMYVTDVNGNVDSCIANVIVNDTVKPNVICKDTTIYLNPSGTFTIDSSFIDNGSTSACGITTITLSNYNYTCTDTGINLVTMYVTDANGNIDSCSANVIVIDNTLPNPICKDTTIYLNIAGTFTIDSSFIDNGSNDNCAISTITLNNYNFTCTNIGTNTVTMYVTDVNNNIDSCTANVFVFDTINPNPICKDTTIYLNIAGIFTIDSSFVNNGSNDNCNVNTITLSKYNFNCTDTGINVITMYVTDPTGNIDSCTSNVTVIDTVGPVALCKDTTIYLNASGTYTIDSSYIDNGSSDACGILTLSQSLFNCTHIGPNNVTLYVTDANSNIDSCTAVVTVLDTIRPAAICKDTTIYLNVGGTFTIDSSYVNNISNDACGIATITLSQYTFDCSDIGVNPIIMSVTDVNGNVQTCNTNVTVVDTVNPIPICKDTTIYLNIGGSFTIDSSYINNGSNDACGIATITLSEYNYTCANIGTNPITMYVTDVNGNLDSCTANVVVVDTIPPAPVCKDTTIYLDITGGFTIDSSYIENGSTDACGIATITLSEYSYTCANIGSNPITMYVTDIYGNIDSCNANVIVVDTVPPTPICKDTTIYLDITGGFTIDSSYIENGSTDACGIATITLSQYSYTCANIGSNPITMYVTDIYGNIDSCNANVIVVDTVPPTPICKDTTIYLNAGGAFTIDSSFINNISTDACGIATITLSDYNYNCVNVGTNAITMYVTDIYGNIDSCNANVIVVDTVRPNPVCKDTTIYLNAGGTFTIDSSYTENGSTDACGIETITLNQYTFDCSHIGTNTITMTVNDINGNIDSCVSTVTVVDTTNPTPICKDTTIYLLSNGQFIIDSSFINNGSNDICGISTITLSKYFYDCSDTGTSVVTMYVTDVNGNLDSCNANITIVDTILPVALCKDTTIYLNTSGVFIIDSSYIDNGSSDACGILTISQSLFNCSHIGPNNVTLYVTDANLNLDSCTSTVTVLDTVRPTPICKDTLIYLDSFGQFTLDSSFINNGSNDACGIATITLDKYTYTCADTGVNTVLMTVTDVNGNIDSCFATIIVRDSIIPYVDAGLDDSLCAQYTYVLNGNVPTGTLIGTWRIVNAPNIPLFSSFSQANPTVTNLIEGQYTFSWSVTNGLGCNLRTDTVEIYIYDQPVSNAGADTSLCNTYTMNMRANVPAGLSTGAWTYLSPAPSVPVIANSTDPYTNISGLVEGNYTFIWTVSNGNCTPVTSAITISVYDPPTANAGNNQDLCNTYNTILLGNTPAGTSTGLWNLLSGPNVPTITTPNNAVTGFNGMIEGTYTLTWTVSNGTCNPAIDTMLINVYDTPISNAGADTNLCAIYNLNLYANMPLGTAYGQWLVNPNFTPPSTPTFADSSIYNTNISGLVEGTYNLLWIVRNGNCAAAIDSITIDVWDRPTVYAGIDTSLCSIYNLRLYATPITGSSKGQWSLDPSFSNPNVPNIANSSQPDASITGLIEGTYRFIWNVTNGPCFDISDTMIINVYDQPTAIVGPDQDLCFLNSTNINAVPLNGTATGTWNLANGTPNIPTFNPNTSSTTVGSMQEGGNYVLYWEAVNGTCPVSRDSVVINNYAVPIAQFTQDSIEVCRDGCIQFTNQSTIHSSSTITYYQWNATGDANYDEDALICWPYPGLFDVRLIVESNNGCRDTINKADLITVNTIPIADFNTFLVDDPNTSTKIQIQDNSQFSDSYWYSLGDGTTTTLQNPEHTYLDSGFYDITQIVSNTFGCKDTLRKTVFVHVLVVYVPNTFTPDGNGINDNFLPAVSGDDPDAFLFRVFNRWGELIFQSQVKGLGWDGTYNNQPAKTDVYVWTLRTKYKDGDREKEYRGHVNLLR